MGKHNKDKRKCWKTKRKGRKSRKNQMRSDAAEQSVQTPQVNNDAAWFTESLTVRQRAQVFYDW